MHRQSITRFLASAVLGGGTFKLESSILSRSKRAANQMAHVNFEDEVFNESDPTTVICSSHNYYFH
jgi:hypothetical protein